MGTWGHGNFQSDDACDLRDTFVRNLVGRIGKLFQSKKLDIFKAEAELMPWLAILVAVCDRCKGHPPRPHIVSDWKRQYLEIFNSKIKDIARADHIPKRRRVIRSTFAKLEKIARKLYGDFSDEDLPQPGA